MTKQELLSSTAVQPPAPRTGKAAIMDEFLRYCAMDTVLFSPMAMDAALYGQSFAMYYEDGRTEHVELSDIMTPAQSDMAKKLMSQSRQLWRTENGGLRNEKKYCGYPECTGDDNCPMTKMCCCGSEIEAHGTGDGHSPVDAHWYYANKHE